jgi:SHS2 domain-containing protein
MLFVMGDPASHVFEDHESEAQVRIVAPSLAELFAEAGRAVAELMLGEATPGELGPPEHVVVRAPDRDALLVAWLNELEFHSETRKRVYTSFDVERVTDGEIAASVRGVEATELATPVKAATMHGVRIEHGARGFDATVVLDV